MSYLWFMFGNVHSQLYELSYRGTWYGTSRKRNNTCRIRLAKHAGMAVMDMYNKGIKARDIITKDAIMNALTVDMALGCSTNSMLHLPAIAHEIGFDFDISFANPISERTPNLCHLAPAGPTYMEDLNEAGGVWAVMKELADIGLLNTDCMTVTGKTVGENIKNAVNRDPEVIRPVDNPYSKTGGLAVLKGNLAPDGSVVKRSAVVDEMMVHEGPARVFDCEEDAIAAIKGGKIVEGDVVVIRYEGPKGGPGMREMLNPTSKEKAQAHINAGARKVVISAPAGNDLPTIVYNTNHETLKASDTIISAASCTTNCLAPMADALNKYAPIQSGIMVTIHAYTGDQMTLDGPQRKGDLRRSRAAAVNIVPNSTGAAKAIGLVIPELNGKLIGSAQRVPTPTGSTTILTAVVKKAGVTKEDINAAMKAAANESFGYNEDEIVSSDIVGMRFGSLFDATQTMVNQVSDDLYEVQVVSWYDNENSYTSQMVRTIKYFSELA